MKIEKKIGLVFFIMMAAAFCSFLTTVILGRNLPVVFFGKFKFIHSIVIMLSGLLVLGQNTAIVRIFSKADFNQYNWRMFIRNCLILASAFCILAVTAIAFFYDLRKEMIFICAAIISSVAIDLYSSLLRSKAKYKHSAILAQSPLIGFFIMTVILIYVFKAKDIWLILYGYSLVFIFSLLLGIFMIRGIASGKDKFPFSAVKDGLWLFFIAISFTIMMHIDRFFIVKMLGFDQVAGYSAVISATRGFEIFTVALWFVLMPHYSKNKSHSLVLDNLKVAAAGVLLVFVYLFAGKFLLHFFFDSKFDQFSSLMNIFIAIGFCKVLYTIPSGIIGGRFSTKMLKVFLICCVLGIFINVAGNLYLIPLWGLKGAAAATLLSWIFRVISAQIIVFKNEKKEKLILKMA